jgi:hypothetical protein
MEYATLTRFSALRGALASLALAIFASSLQAVPITDFHIYAARNVIVGGNSTVGTPINNSNVGAGTMVVGVGDGTVAGGAGIYGNLSAGDDVTLNNNSFVTGTITNPDNFNVGSGVSYGAHISAMPALPTLPAATVFSDGVLDVSTGNGGTITLAPGSYDDISLGGAATLNLSAGSYFLRSLSAGNGLTINSDFTGGNIYLYITLDFNAGGTVAMNMTNGTWKNMYAETHSTSINAFRIGGGSGTNWHGTVFTPNGGIHFGSGSSSGVVEGYLWAGLDVDIEHSLDVIIPEPSSFVLAGISLAAGIAHRGRRGRKR